MFSGIRQILKSICALLFLVFGELIIKSPSRDCFEANVTAIYKKKGLRCEPGNYRPVSLTSQIGRIFERIVRDHLVRFLEENELLNDSQHGFRSKRSCLTNLLEFLDLVTNYVDQGIMGIPVDVIYLDFQKAFDKVSHSKLIAKMKRSSSFYG